MMEKIGSFVNDIVNDIGSFVSVEQNFVVEEVLESEEFEFYDEIVYVGNEWLCFVIGMEDYLDFVVGLSIGDSIVFLGIFIDDLFGEEKLLKR